MNPMPLLRRLLCLVLRLLGWLALALTALWSAGAIYYSNLPAPWMRSAGAWLFPAAR